MPQLDTTTAILSIQTKVLGKCWTHPEELCGHKKRAGSKELNAQEETVKDMLSIMQKQGKTIAELLKQMQDNEEDH